jgi:hypothetical protein
MANRPESQYDRITTRRWWHDPELYAGIGAWWSQDHRAPAERMRDSVTAWLRRKSWSQGDLITASIIITTTAYALREAVVMWRVTRGDQLSLS